MARIDGCFCDRAVRNHLRIVVSVRGLCHKSERVRSERRYLFTERHSVYVGDGCTCSLNGFSVSFGLAKKLWSPNEHLEVADLHWIHDDLLGLNITRISNYADLFLVRACAAVSAGSI